jgi:hypothetical protein
LHRGPDVSATSGREPRTDTIRPVGTDRNMHPRARNGSLPINTGMPVASIVQGRGMVPQGSLVPRPAEAAVAPWICERCVDRIRVRESHFACETCRVAICTNCLCQARVDITGVPNAPSGRRARPHWHRQQPSQQTSDATFNQHGQFDPESFLSMLAGVPDGQGVLDGRISLWGPDGAASRLIPSSGGNMTMGGAGMSNPITMGGGGMTMGGGGGLGAIDFTHAFRTQPTYQSQPQPRPPHQPRYY